MTRSTDLSAGYPMFDNAPCGHLVFDRTGHIVETNARLRDWLGKSASDMRGKAVSHVFSMASQIVYETSVVPLLSLKGQADGVSLDLRAQDGTKVPVILSAETSGTGSEQLTAIIFLRADARRTFERDLAMARAEAEAKLKATLHEGELREQFVAILGHDLRNPLASISSAVRIISKEPLSSRGTEIVKLTQGSVRRMSLLIDNVLDFARKRLGGGIELTLSNDDGLEEEIKQVVDELHSAHPEREIKVEVSGPHSVQCDVPRLGQLLSNLLGNALTYGDPESPIQVILDKTDDTVFELSVSNRGTPIPPSAMERLFDPFVRSSNHEDRNGLGLGLYIASEIAQAHGGTLDVLSNEEWTTFTLCIPINDRNQAVA